MGNQRIFKWCLTEFLLANGELESPMSPHNLQAELYHANAGAADEGDVVTWDDAYAIACALRALHPDVPPEDLSLMKIYAWTVALPNFSDDPALANEAILTAIISEWFEEANPA